MQNDAVLLKFRQFKELFISSNVPNNILLELIESYIEADDSDDVILDTSVIDGQLSLFDIAA